MPVPGYTSHSYHGVYRFTPASPALYDVQHHHKKLTCTAHTHPFDAVSTSVTLEIHRESAGRTCRTHVPSVCAVL